MYSWPLESKYDIRINLSSFVFTLNLPHNSPSLPTLFLSECVLIYIQPGDSDAIVNWVGTNMDASLFVVYEQINPADAFGAMMLRNLRVRKGQKLSASVFVHISYKSLMLTVF